MVTSAGGMLEKFYAAVSHSAEKFSFFLNLGNWKNFRFSQQGKAGGRERHQQTKKAALVGLSLRGGGGESSGAADTESGAFLRAEKQEIKRGI